MQYKKGMLLKHEHAVNIVAEILMPLPDFWNKVQWYVRTSSGLKKLKEDYIYMHPSVWFETNVEPKND